MKTDDLVLGLMSMMESDQLASLLAKDINTLEEILQPFLDECSDPDALRSAFTIFLRRVRLDSDLAILREIFNTMAARFNLNELDEGTVNDLLKGLLKKVTDFKDPDVINNLFRTLLEKVDLITSNREILNETLMAISSRISSERDQDTVTEMYLTLLNSVNLETIEHPIIKETVRILLRRIEVEQDVSLLAQLFNLIGPKVPMEWKREVMAPFFQDQKVRKSPLLPKNCILYQEKLDGTKIVVLEIEKQKFNVVYHKTPIMEVGHPKLLFVFNVLRDRILSVQIVAVRDKIIRPSTKLYRYPFSNVYSNTFQACWPDKNNIRVKEIYQLSGLPYSFISTPSNDHLYDGTNLRELLVSLSGKDFDESILKETPYTFSDFFDMNDTE